MMENLIPNPQEIEIQEPIRTATEVLKRLEVIGLKEPAIAGGWIRGWLTGMTPTDIDVAYVGDIDFNKAQMYLVAILDQLGLDKSPWDIKGIWNAQMENSLITSTEMNYHLFYVDSIDSVCLKSDGKLHDITGHGFSDAQEKILRMNDFTKYNFPYSDSKIIWLCLEGIRRIAKFGWIPTERSGELIQIGLPKWKHLSSKSKEYFMRRMNEKYTPPEMQMVRDIYSNYGWDFILDLALNNG